LARATTARRTSDFGRAATQAPPHDGSTRDQAGTIWIGTILVLTRSDLETEIGQAESAGIGRSDLPANASHDAGL